MKTFSASLVESAGYPVECGTVSYSQELLPNAVVSSRTHVRESTYSEDFSFCSNSSVTIVAVVVVAAAKLSNLKKKKAYSA